jgi:hypothetical protein
MADEHVGVTGRVEAGGERGLRCYLNGTTPRPVAAAREYLPKRKRQSTLSTRRERSGTCAFMKCAASTQHYGLSWVSNAIDI